MPLHRFSVAAVAAVSLLAPACKNTNLRDDGDARAVESTAVQRAATGVPAPLPQVTQFDITGFLQEASTTGSGATAGGSLKVNGHVIAIPENTVVTLPASQLTWAELFTQAPAPYGPSQTGLALADVPAPLATAEVHVIGNRVTSATGGDQYIAGLVYVFQQSLDQGAGFINYIDYDRAELRVGGVLGDPSTGARVRINDPVVGTTGTGRYSKGLSADKRFTVDQDNPSVLSATGFPMCLPRAAPPAPNAAETDPLCPQGNRPLDLTGAFLISIHMADPASLAPGQLPDARIQAPLEVGDYITYAGFVTADRADGLSGPWPGTPNSYVAAHSIVDNTAIYTAPGSNPAYVMVDVTLEASGGADIAGAAEAATRTRFEGMTTDPSRSIHLYGIDLDPVTGATTDRDWGTIGVDPGPPAGGVTGRWRFRPPCVAFGTAPADPTKTCVQSASGTFLPPTREVRAVIEGQQGQVPGTAGAQTAANGIFYGQYHSPISEILFPENVPGSPPVANNFEAIPFLACGGTTSATGVVVGQLRPWPGAVAPTCAGVPTAPVVDAGPAQIVASGATVTLAGTATGTAPIALAWAQIAGPPVALSDPTAAHPTFTAPAATTGPIALSFTLTASNAIGAASATVNITISTADTPTVVHVLERTVASATPVTLTATCQDPGGLPCMFAWLQTGGTPVVLSPNPQQGASIHFTVALPVGGSPSSLQFQIVATNSAGASSLPDTTSVTITPPPDAVALTTAEFRTGKGRLTITATSSLISPSVNLTLDPYRTTTGATFDPASLGASLVNGGNGSYSLQLDGVPEPALPPATPLTLHSTAGGVSPPGGLTRIRT